jgi:hypothetical protein
VAQMMPSRIIFRRLFAKKITITRLNFKHAITGRKQSGSAIPHRFAHTQQRNVAIFGCRRAFTVAHQATVAKRYSGTASDQTTSCKCPDEILDVLAFLAYLIPPAGFGIQHIPCFAHYGFDGFCTCHLPLSFQVSFKFFLFATLSRNGLDEI